jgi:hypothetical protein
LQGFRLKAAGFTAIGITGITVAAARPQLIGCRNGEMMFSRRSMPRSPQPIIDCVLGGLEKGVEALGRDAGFGGC